MTYEEIKLLADLLMVLENSEGAVENEVDNIFEREAILQREYFMKLKGVAKLEYINYNSWGYYNRNTTKFRPVIEINYGGEIFSFVLNQQSATLVYDINSNEGVGEDSKKERVYENLLNYAGLRDGVNFKHRINEQPKLQYKLLVEFLQAVFLE